MKMCACKEAPQCPTEYRKAACDVTNISQFLTNNMVQLTLVMQDPNTWKVERTLFIMTKQNFRGKPFFQAAKQHLNNS